MCYLYVVLQQLVCVMIYYSSKVEYGYIRWIQIIILNRAISIVVVFWWLPTLTLLFVLFLCVLISCDDASSLVTSVIAFTTDRSRAVVLVLFVHCSLVCCSLHCFMFNSVWCLIVVFLGPCLALWFPRLKWGIAAFLFLPSGPKSESLFVHLIKLLSHLTMKLIRWSYEQST